jgi:beta-mannosidase
VKNGTADIFITSDLADATHGKLTWNVTDLSGQSLVQDSMHLKIPGRKSEMVKTLNLQDQVQKQGPDGILTWLKLEVHGKTVSENLVMLALPKELNLSDPGLSVSADESGDGFLVTLQSQKPALWTWLELDKLDAKFSDNFVHVTPDLSRTIFVEPASQLSKDDFLKALRVRSLFNTYSV